MSCSLTAQEKFVVYDEEIGYCSHSYHIIQDSYGFLWSATLTGLVKTDGYEYKKFTNEREDTTTIATNFSTYLYEDQFSNIWINSHQYGLSIYDRSEDRFVRIKAGGKEGLKSDQITDMISVGDSVLYICGNAGLERVVVQDEDYSELKFDLFTYDHDKKVQSKWSDRIWDAELISDHRLFLSSIVGYALFDIDSQEFIYSDEEPLIPNGVGFVSCHDQKRGNLWVAPSGKPLIKINLKTGKSQAYKELICPGGEHYMMIDSDDRLWIKENGFGLNRIDLKTEKIDSYKATKDSKINYKDRWARRMIETEDGSIFIASSSESRFQHIPSIAREIESFVPLDSKNNNVSSIYEDDDLLVISFYNNGIFIKEKKTGEERRLTTNNSELTDNLVFDVKMLRDGQLLILGKPHAYLLNVDSYKLSIISTSFFYRNGIELSNGDLWLFSEAYAIDHLKRTGIGKYEKVQFEGALSKIINYREAIENDDGTIWIITAAKGLILTNKEGEILKEYTTNLDNPNSIISKTSECLFKDSKGRVWIGSLEGLSMLTPETGQFMNFTIKNGLDDTSISDIAEDDAGQIWVSSFDGMYKYDEDQNRLFRVPSSQTLNNNYGQRGFFKCQDRLYAAGTKGIDIIKSTSQVLNTVPPKVWLTNIYKNDEKVSTARNLETQQKLIFRPEDKDVFLEFAALHYGTPSSKSYQYREVDSNSEWVDFSNTRKVSMSKFSYGNHKIEIRASNADGAWSEPKIFDINLKAPWYYTYWFFAFMIFGICGLLYGLYKWRLTQMEKIKQQQLEIDRQIAEMELKALKAQMNPHFVFNSLNSVKALIQEKKTNEAVIYLTSFSKLIRKILNNSNDKFIRLQDEIDTVKLYLELEALRFDDAFVYNIEVDDNVGIDFVEVPALLLQPYIENAIWHGLLHKSEGQKRLDININQKGDSIEIVIEDNGIGREAAQQIKTRSKSKNQSFGMSINNQRINLLKELYGNNASIDIIDLKNDLGKPTGTKVIVKFDN